MIRLIQRRLIIPRGDTGTFTVPVLATKNTGDVAVFSIIDTMTDKKVFEKIVNVSGDTMTIEFSHYDTVNLPVGKYVWDIKFYQNPEFMDGVLVNGVEVDSYYAAFTMPICEIRQTGDNLLMADDAPGTELTPDQLDILNAAVNETNAAKSQANESAASANTAATTAADKADEATAKAEEATAKAEEATAALNELKEILPTLAEVATSGSYEDLEDKPFIPSRVSDLQDDSGHYTKPANGIPASDLEETYLTEHQDISGKADKSEIPTKVSQLQNDSGYLTSFTETDPTVPAWAKAAQKPSYTAAEVGAPTVAEMNTAIGTAIGNINSFDIAVVQTLPTQDISTHTIYLVPKTGETNDVYDEYIYINDAWEMVGNTQIDLSNYVQKTDYATSSKAGIIKLPSDAGLTMLAGQYLMIAPASPEKIKASQHGASPITTGVQHTSTFYGLAKAAGDNTQSQSDNAVGTYTDEAKAAIQTMLDVPAKADIPDTSIYATKTDTVLETTLSRGRKEGTTVGMGSFVFGNNVEASGANSFAIGDSTQASGNMSFAEGCATIASGEASHAEANRSTANGVGSHAEGMLTIANGSYSHSEGARTTANGDYSHAEGIRAVSNGVNSYAGGNRTIANGASSIVFGMRNVEDSYASWPEWVADTEYDIGDKVKRLIIQNNETTVSGYICKIENQDHEFNVNNWTLDRKMNYANIIGNGTADNARSNAYALDWDGNGHYAGDVYVHANADSTGGTKLATIADIPDAPVQDVQVNGVSVLQDGVANVPVASNTVYGVVKTNSSYGVYSGNDGILRIGSASPAQCRQQTGSTGYQNITVNNQHASAFYGLAKAAGDTTQSSSSNAVGTYTDNAKASIKSMLGIVDGSTGTVDVSGATPTINAVENTRYVCGEVTSLSFTPPSSGISIVRFTSGSTVTVLTIPSTVKFPEWFDPTALETNTIYEICITDGTFGAVMSWAL